MMRERDREQTENVFFPMWFSGRLPTEMPAGAIGVGFAFLRRTDAEAYGKAHKAEVMEMQRTKKNPLKLFLPPEPAGGGT